MIIEQSIKTLDNIPPKCNKPPQPQSKNKYLTPFYHNALFIGATNSGKSYAMVKHIKNYEENPVYDCHGNKLKIKVVLFCPTAQSEANPIFHTIKDLKEEDIIEEYTNEILQEKINELEDIKIEIEERETYIAVYNKAKKLKNIEKLDYDELELLESNNFQHPKDLPPLEYEHFPIVFFIFDDLLNNDKAFKKNGKDGISKLIIKSRHHKINMLISGQYMKGLSPSIRTNCQLFVIFKFANAKRVLEHIYPEVSALLNEDEFEELYKYSTDNPHDAFVIDNHANTPRERRFKKNFDTLLLNDNIMKLILDKKKSNNKSKQNDKK